MDAKQRRKPHGSNSTGKRGGARVSKKPTCGAHSRSSGKPCPRPAGWGTDHVGTGKCRNHGGSSHGRPIIHGRYSNVTQRIREFVAIRIKTLDDEAYVATYLEFTKDKDINSVTHEVALLRTALVALGDILEDPKAKGLAGPFIATLPATMRIEAIAELAERIVRCVKRKVDMEEGLAIRLTPTNTHQLVTAIGRAIGEHVSDPKTRADIAGSLRRLLGAGELGQLAGAGPGGPSGAASDPEKSS